MINFDKLAVGNSQNSVINPRELFSALPNKNKKYQYLRDVQAEVLQRWFKDRAHRDLVLKMNTGSGKTIVGLLLLKSCLNEGKGPALFVVSDSVLVQQVVEEAANIGIDVTTEPNSIDYKTSKSICVVNIYKLMNGRSVFGVNDEKIKIGSVVIDDAHSCVETIESQFTLQIEGNNPAYNKILKLFRDDLDQQSRVGVVEVESQDSTKNMLVPYWAWQDKVDSVIQYIREGLDCDDRLHFNWNLIKDNIDLCRCVIGGGQVEISPYIIPINVISSFNNASRRIFMSATLCNDNILSTHLDIDIDSVSVITPEYANDIGDRMIVVPQIINPDITEDKIREYLSRKSSEVNIVAIVPSHHRSRLWGSYSDCIVTQDNFNEKINEIKTGKICGLTIIVNKYDGIDLPGDSCRILILDGLPDVRRKIDKLEQSMLVKSDLFLSKLVQRIEQGMGRGVRSNDDYCVVFLMGVALVNALYANNSLNMLSEATRTQISLSRELSDQISKLGITEINNLINYSLSRDSGWVGAAKARMATLRYNNELNIDELSVARRSAYNSASCGNYNEAITLLQSISDRENSSIVKGYILMQVAEYANFVDKVNSQNILNSAKRLNRHVLKPKDGVIYSRIDAYREEQATRCLTRFREEQENKNRFKIEMDSLIDNLQFSTVSARDFERSLQEIGTAIGFATQRPDNEFGEGPDVLFNTFASEYVFFECKNEATGETISKKYCDQLSGQVNWLESKYGICKYTPIIVHPSNTIDKGAAPHPKMLVMNGERLSAFRAELKKFFVALIRSQSLTSDGVARLLNEYYLSRERFIHKFTTPYKAA